MSYVIHGTKGANTMRQWAPSIAATAANIPPPDGRQSPMCSMLYLYLYRLLCILLWEYTSGLRRQHISAKSACYHGLTRLVAHIHAKHGQDQRRGDAATPLGCLDIIILVFLRLACTSRLRLCCLTIQGANALDSPCRAWCPHQTSGGISRVYTNCCSASYCCSAQIIPI